MDKERATKILSAELARHSGTSIVRDTRYQEELMKNAKNYCQFSDPLVVNYDYFEDLKSAQDSKPMSGWHFFNTEQRSKTHKVYQTLEKLIKKIEYCDGANYFFIDNPIQNKEEEKLCGFHFFVTPYSIIGENEQHNLRELFYKDVPSKVICAMDSLDIENYTNIYKAYLNLNVHHPYYSNDAIKTFIDNYSKLYYDADSEISIRKLDKIGDKDLLNSELEKIDIKARLSTKEYRSSSTKLYPSLIHNNIKGIADEIRQRYGSHDKFIKSSGNLLGEFNNFVFTLPYEEQNIQSNKIFLRLYSNKLYYPDILTREYSQGQYFQEYFNCLDKTQQETVVSCLKGIEERNISHDSFLWSKGFKGIQLDYMALYQNNAGGFIDYFSSKNPDDKRIIIKDIMGCDYTNKPVAEWLDENEIDLVREVSMDG